MFSKGPLVFQNHAWVKGPCQMQDRPIDINETKKERFLDIFSDYTLQLTYKKRIIKG